MAPAHRALTEDLLFQAQHTLRDVYLPRISTCLTLLSDEEIWWRPHPSSNSAGNLVLHLCGNVRQWIISGLGDEPDQRQRDQEFAEQGPVARRLLLTKLRKTVKEAVAVLARLTPRDLARHYSIQGYDVTGLDAVFHVTEHFALHSGQIMYIAKLKRGEDLGFTRLPGDRPKRRAKRLPAV